MSLTLLLLGRIRVVVGSETLPAIPQRKGRALLAYLSLSPGQTRSRDALTALLWGDRDEEHARASLRQALTSLRKWLEPSHSGLLQADKESVTLLHAALQTDVREFERQCASKTISALTKAVALYRGDFLEDLHIQEMSFEEWQWSERLRLRQLASNTFQQLASHQLSEGDDDAALATARRLLTIDPVRESGHRLVMQALAHLGQRTAALEQYRACERLLGQDLGVKPSPETQQLFADIRRRSMRATTNDMRPKESTYLQHGGDTVENPERAAIAVLPFNNLSGDPDQEYFADGMAEDIITGLSRFRSLFVIARNSTFAYKGMSPDVRDVSRDLGSHYVVEGSVRRSDQRIRITAQLINAETGNHLWAERYDRELEDIFAIQDEVTEAIVAAIAPEVSRAEIDRARRRPPDDLDAWSRYQRGLAAYYSSTKEGLTSAIEQFDRVNDIDRTFAPAFAMAAAARWRYALHFEPGNLTEILNQALKKAYMAITLDPRDATGLCHAGEVHSMLGQHELAISKLEEAVTLNPADAMARYFLGGVLRRAGRSADAIPHFDHAMRLSPRDIWITGMLSDRAFVLFDLERYEEAFVWAQRARLSPHPRTMTFAVFAAVLTKLGRLDEAQSAVNDLLAHAPGLTYTKYRNNLFGAPSVMERLASALRDAGLPE